MLTAKKNVPVPPSIFNKSSGFITLEFLLLNLFTTFCAISNVIFLKPIFFLLAPLGLPRCPNWSVLWWGRRAPLPLVVFSSGCMRTLCHAVCNFPTVDINGQQVGAERPRRPVVFCSWSTSADGSRVHFVFAFLRLHENFHPGKRSMTTSTRRIHSTQNPAAFHITPEGPTLTASAATSAALAVRLAFTLLLSLPLVPPYHLLNTCKISSGF